MSYLLENQLKLKRKKTDTQQQHFPNFHAHKISHNENAHFQMKVVGKCTQKHTNKRKNEKFCTKGKIGKIKGEN